jgi:hypothetical protein
VTVEVFRCSQCMAKTELAPLKDLRCHSHPEGPNEGPHDWVQGWWVSGEEWETYQQVVSSDALLYERAKQSVIEARRIAERAARDVTL